MFNPFRKKTVDPLHNILVAIDNAATHYEVIAQLRASAREIAGADGIAIVRREGDEVVCLTENAVAPLWSGRRFPINTCVSRRPLIEGVPVVVHDLDHDVEVRERDNLPPFIKSIAVYPLGGAPLPMALGIHWYAANAVERMALDRIARLAAAAGRALVRIDTRELCDA